MNRAAPSLFERYADVIAASSERDEFSRADLLVPEFRLVKDKSLEIYYAPLDFINTQAKVAVVGITPGWTQDGNRVPTSKCSFERWANRQ